MWKLKRSTDGTSAPRPHGGRKHRSYYVPVPHLAWLSVPYINLEMVLSVFEQMMEVRPKEMESAGQDHSVGKLCGREWSGALPDPTTHAHVGTDIRRVAWPGPHQRP